MRTLLAAACTLPLALVLALPAPARAEGDDDGTIRDGLEKQRQFADAGRRVEELRRELSAAGGDAWVQRAILLVELADTGDRRAVQHLAGELLHKKPHPHVVAFALHGLKRYAAGELHKGGGAPLVEGLIEALEMKGPWVRQTAHELLCRVVGEDLGRKAGKWKSWLKKHGDELVVEDPPFPFDESKYDAERVAKVRQQTGDKGTQVHKRIPPIASEIRELNEKGLDIVLCLDQTSSMGPVIEEAKQRIDVLVSCVREVVKEHRVGLVTYDDAVKITVPLTPDVGRLRETLSRVEAFGGMDMPEGVDKALGVALRPDFGWRQKATRVAVVIGDAPPHEPDVEPTLKLLEQLHGQAGFVVHTVATGFELPEFKRLAEAGGGQALQLGDPSKLVSEVLLLIFGERLRPAMERFVPVLLEILSAQEAGRR